MKIRLRTSQRILLGVLLIACSSFLLLSKERPTLYIIGDSTVRNTERADARAQWGWGSFIAGYFDTTSLRVRNAAIGGRSSRTFMNEGRWDRIKSELGKGDYVLIQFGHNDGGPLDDSARARGSIRGIGTESREVYNPVQKKQEVVYTFGQYLRTYIRDAKAAGATPVVCSPIPRNIWKDGKVVRSKESYAGWAQTIAAEEGVSFIDLNELVAAKYEELGQDSVKTFFPIDHTHTNQDGARLNAQIVVAQLQKINPGNVARFAKK
jgi:rhamnogalacturonan acetylesterase